MLRWALANGLVLLTALTLCPQENPAQLVRKLGSEDVAERDDATRRLRALGKAATVELEKGARDPDAEIASRAGSILRLIELAGRIPPRLHKLFPNLEGRLNGEDREWTTVFMEAAARGEDGKRTHPEVTREDLDFLASRAMRALRAKEQWAAIQTVRENDLRSALPGILRLIEETSAPHMEAVILLGDMKAHELLPDLLKFVTTCNDSAYWAAEMSLTRVVRPGDEASLAELLKSDRPRVRRTALVALFWLRSAGAAPRILEALDDPEPMVREKAVQAAGGMGLKEATPRLILLLRATEVEVRLAAIRALGELDAHESVSALKALLKDPSAEIRAGAIEAMGTFEVHDSAPALIALLSDGDRGVVWTSARVLGDLKAKEAAAPLAGLLAHEFPGIREAAARALGQLKARDQVERVRALLKDPVDRVQVEGARALAEIEPAEAIAAILPLLREKSSTVRAEIASVLAWRLEAKEAIPDLRRMLEAGDTSVAAGLCVLGVADGVPALLKSAERDTYAQIMAINCIRNPEAWRRLKSTPIVEDHGGTRRELLEWIAGRAGLKLKIGEPASEDERTFISEQKAFGPGWGSLLNALWNLQHASRTGCRFEVILEGDVLRFVPRNEALKLWNAWWEQQPKPSK